MKKPVTHYDIINAKEYHNKQELYRCAQSRADRVKYAYNTLMNPNDRRDYDRHLKATAWACVLWKISRLFLKVVTWILVVFAYFVLIAIFQQIYLLFIKNNALTFQLGLFSVACVMLAKDYFYAENEGFRWAVQRLKDKVKIKPKPTLYEEIYATPRLGQEGIKQSFLDTKAAIDESYRALTDPETRKQQDFVIYQYYKKRFFDTAWVVGVVMLVVVVWFFR